MCAFATEVKHATGIDMTPAMLDRARPLAVQPIATVDELLDRLERVWP